MSASTQPMADLDGRDVAALTEYMTTLADVDRARGADSLYVVVAQSGREYLVDAETGACECDDSFYRHPEGGCKHVRRVGFATGRREIPAWVNRSRVDPQLGIHVDDVSEEDDLDRGKGIETDGGNSHAARVEAQLRMAEEEGIDIDRDRDDDDDTPIFHVGDHVQDREDPDATMLVVGLPLQRAATYVVDEDSGSTVADYNDDYPETDHAIEVVYPQRTDTFLNEKREYAFPHSRLELVGPIHDRDEDDQESEDDE